MSNPGEFGGAPIHGPTLGEQIARRVRSVLDNLPAASWDDLWYLLDTVFVGESAADKLERYLTAAMRGRIRPAPKGSNEPFDMDCAEEDSAIGPGDPPDRLPGLLDYVFTETHHQYRLLIQQEMDPLSKMGLRKIVDPGAPLPFTVLRRGVLLDGLEAGSTMVVSGVPGSGKSYVAVEDVIGPAIERDWHVVSNIEVGNAGPNYHHVSKVSDYLLAIIELALAERTILSVRDEGAIGRGRSRAQAQRNQDMKMLTMVNRKFGSSAASGNREVNIYQRVGDVPPELMEFCTHMVIKPRRDRQDVALVNTPVLRQLAVAGIPGNAERQRLGWKVYTYNPYEQSILAHDLQLLPLLEYQPVGRDGRPLSPKARLEAMRDRILVLKGQVDKETPLTIEQLLRVVMGMHVASTKWGYRKFHELMVDEWTRAGVRSTDALYKLLKDLRITSHADAFDDWCGWCLDNREAPAPRMKRPARPALAAAPPAPPTS